MILANQRLKQWKDSKEAYPSFTYTLGTLFQYQRCPQNARGFSSTKKLITPERNRLAEDIIEASECLKNWWGHALIQQQSDGQVV